MDFEMELCGGCTTCEIACSFRHLGKFNNQVSSIEIVPLEDKPGYKVRIHEAGDGSRFICDGCKDVDGGPLCTRYCPEREDLMEIIQQYRDKKSI